MKRTRYASFECDNYVKHALSKMLKTEFLHFNIKFVLYLTCYIVAIT